MNIYIVLFNDSPTLCLQIDVLAPRRQAHFKEND